MTSPRPTRQTRTVVVDVMLKPEILDPQGQAVLGVLPQLGVDGVTAVRIGKHVELEVATDADGALDEAALEQVRDLAHRLLANPVIEDFVLRVDG